MSLYLVDINQSALAKAEEEIKNVQGVGEVYSSVVDVGEIDQVVQLRDKVLDIFGEVRLSSSFHLVLQR